MPEKPISTLPRRLISVLSAVPLFTGCASIGAHSEGPTSTLYPGLRGAAHCVAHPKDAPHPVLSAIDLPFSAVFDTLCLPCDSVAWIASSRREPSNKDEQDP